MLQGIGKLLGYFIQITQHNAVFVIGIIEFYADLFHLINFHFMW